MKFENTKVMNFEAAIRGMRNPMNSWDKSDSKPGDPFIIGSNDLKLAQSLIRAGSSHRKFMRQIFVSVDITAPLYWYKEFDTYKVGTTANSCSTMHKIHAQPITLDCFELDDSYDDYEPEIRQYATNTVAYLEYLRQKFISTNDQLYWKELIRWLPSAWMQKRTITLTYENLLAMCAKDHRRFHKLSEWRTDFIGWARTLPYSQELIFIDELCDGKRKERLQS